MFRKIAFIAATSLVAVASLSAGSVQIGGVNGITSVYDGGTSANGCAAPNGPNWLGCPTTNQPNLNGASPNPAERNYETNLFSGVSSATNPGYPTATTMSGGGFTFAMLNDSAAAGSNYWALIGVSGITIPMGVFGVTDVGTMLNDNWGCTAGQASGPCVGASSTDTQVKFTFDAASNGSDAASLEQVTFNLVNGNEIRDAVICNVGGCSTMGYATSLVATNSLAPSAQSGPVSVGNLTIKTGNLYQSAYDFTGAAGNYSNSSGSVVLDYQDFVFGSLFVNDYLVKVNIFNPNAATGVSRTGLSAISVDVVPEPSTWLLIAGGIGLIGFKRFRRA